MMTCREIRRWISPYLDSELGHTKTFEISEHLRACSLCATRFEQERGVDEALADWLRRTPPLDWEAIEAKAMRPIRVVFSPWRLGLLAAAACVVLAAWVVWPKPARQAPPLGINDWLVEQLHEASPAMQRFAPAEQMFTLASVTRETLGVELSFAPGRGLAGHQIELVGVCEKDAGGDCKVVEVRINCCGRPVMLAACRREDFARMGGDPSKLIPSQSVCLSRMKGLEVAAWCDDKVVVVAASDHSAEDLAAVLRDASTDRM